MPGEKIIETNNQRKQYKKKLKCNSQIPQAEQNAPVGGQTYKRVPMSRKQSGLIPLHVCCALNALTGKLQPNRMRPCIAYEWQLIEFSSKLKLFLA